MHVHIQSADGEAKFWLTPEVELAKNYKFSDRDLQRIRELIEENVDEIRNAWDRHFGS